MHRREQLGCAEVFSADELAMQGIWTKVLAMPADAGACSKVSQSEEARMET